MFGQDVRILVTGAAGFVGSRLVRAFLRRSNVKVIGAVYENSHRIRDLRHSRFCVRRLDLSDSSSISALIQRETPTHIVNAASFGVLPYQRDEERMFSVNVAAPAALHRVAAAKGTRRFVQLGSYFEYGDKDGRLDETISLQPRTAYAATKAAASVLLEERAQNGGLETCILRLFNLWGPQEDSQRFVPALIRACLRREDFAMSEGRQLKDYSYVDDAAEWIASLTLLPYPVPWPVINVASGTPLFLADFALSISKYFGVPDRLRLGAVPYRPGDPFRSVANTERIEHLLPERQVTPLEDGLSALAAEIGGT